MTVELETEIEAYARWMEARAGVPLRKPTSTVASIESVGAPTAELELVATTPEPRRRAARHTAGKCRVEQQRPG
jgi:hypothetical protein